MNLLESVLVISISVMYCLSMLSGHLLDKHGWKYNTHKSLAALSIWVTGSLLPMISIFLVRHLTGIYITKEISIIIAIAITTNVLAYLISLVPITRKDN